MSDCFLALSAAQLGQSHSSPAVVTASFICLSSFLLSSLRYEGLDYTILIIHIYLKDDVIEYCTAMRALKRSLGYT